MEREWLVSQLSSLQYKWGLKIANDKAWIRCPFHSKNGQLERTPSLIINLDNSLQYKRGSWHCFGCSKTGSWNELAEVLKLKKVDEETENNEAYVGGLSSNDKQLLFATEDEKEDLNSVPWDENQQWRGISGKLVHKIGGQLCYNNWGDDTELYLPVFMNKKEVGGIHCLIERKSKKQQGYINTKGNWTHESFFPYDYVRRKYKDTNVLFLVEGPRDALNLLQHKIPALAIIGSQNWSEYKLNLLLTQFDINRLVLAFDPDSAGQKAYEKIKRAFKDKAKITKLNMAEGTDPADITREQAKKLRIKLGLN